MSLNKVFLIGRLGADPEIKYSQSGVPVAKMRLATSESFKDKQTGEKREDTQWHNIIAFNRQAENCGSFLKKGSMVCVEGSISTRQYQDQQGQTKYITEIRAQNVQFLDSRGAGGNTQNGGQQRQSAPNEDLGPAFPSEPYGDVPF